MDILIPTSEHLHRSKFCNMETSSSKEAILLLASNGYFPKEFHSYNDLATYAKKPFSIRIAKHSDVNDLVEIEKKCWKNLQLNFNDIRNRLDSFPEGQYVAVINEKIVGVIYTQKIENKDALYGCTFSSQSTLHSMQYNVLQLLGVAVLPDYGNLQVSESLRNFTLTIATINSTIVEVVAMTRCALEYHNESEYFEKFSSDPIVQFHVKGGANVLSIIQHYRPEDVNNYGHAILVCYKLSKQKLKHTANKSEVVEYEDHSVDMKQTISAELLCSLLNTICQTKYIPTHDSFLTKPFMELGLDSLRLMELRSVLAAQLNLTNLSTTLLFDYPTPEKLLRYLNQKSQPGHPPSHTPLSALSSCEDGKLVVTGISCRFPNGANNPQLFYQKLLQAESFSSPIPSDWATKTNIQTASFLSEDVAETFDPDFFHINHQEARLMDPHQKLLLEVVHEALADAQLLDVLSEVKVGLFVGLCNNEWIRLVELGNESINSSLNPYTSSCIAQSSAANRISYLMGLTGPSLVVDTACSSSLSALHVAIQSLKCGDCDVAIVASADLLLSPLSLQIREAAGMLSVSGCNKSFADGADGYVRGEGGAAIVLSWDNESISAPTRTNQKIYAELLGSYANQDGKSASFTAPNGFAQKELLENALRNSAVAAKDVFYIETHGTGKFWVCRNAILVFLIIFL